MLDGYVLLALIRVRQGFAVLKDDRVRVRFPLGNCEDWLQAAVLESGEEIAAVLLTEDFPECGACDSVTDRLIDPYWLDPRTCGLCFDCVSVLTSTFDEWGKWPPVQIDLDGLLAHGRPDSAKVPDAGA